MRNLVLILSVLYQILSVPAKAQQNNNWYFGRQAGLTFNDVNGSAIPSPLQNGQLQADEGSATISDSLGNLLFYTNGVRIFNRQHQLMLNGDSLSGNVSSCQSVIIIPVPGNDSIYYVFTSDAIENSFSNGYRYSIVNIKRDNGNGEVTSKNILLWPSCTERLTAARHRNGIDAWLITNDNNSNIFRSWLITCNGLQPNPVVSTAGVVLNMHTVTNTGYMKISPDGKQLCQTHFPLIDFGNDPPNFFQLFDFDNASGQISNGRSVGLSNSHYNACEYSSNSRLLYLVRPTDKLIDQVDPTLATAAAIAASTVSMPTVNSYFGLQLGPDEKIYMFRSGQQLSVINQPDIRGTGCNMQENQINISPFSAHLGSPAFINDIAATNPSNSFSYTILDSCSGRVQFNASTMMPGPHSWSWDFGDGTSSVLQNPLHTFSPSNRQYTVKLTVRSFTTCGVSRSLKIIKPAGVISDVDFDYVKRCDSGYVRFINRSAFLQNSGGQFTWDFGDGNISTDLHPVHQFNQPGIYPVKLKLTTSVPCLDDSLTVNIEIKTFAINLPPDQTILVGQSVQLYATGEGQSYSWSPPDGLSNPAIARPLAMPLEDITYSVVATDRDGCKSTDSIKITVQQLGDIYVPSGFTPDNNGRNDDIKPFFGSKFILQEFSIFNRWGQRIFTTRQRGKGWNGKINGVEQHSGVYVWLVRAQDETGRQVERKGSFVLIR
ncbi:MAG TPA: PKD domain-containing protein [Chitinophagaceae bacterium]|nr:PKD domain-containing protein [Chitinophagaceae bacterium]